MQRVLMFKVVVVTLLGLALLVPLGMIEDQIGERVGYREFAKSGIAESWTGEQEIIGPIVVVPYTLSSWERVWNKEQKKYEKVERRQHKTHALIPQTLNIESSIETERRQRSIFSIPVYTSKHRFTGVFELEAIHKLTRIKHFKAFGRPYLAVHVTDNRGIATVPKLLWQDGELAFSAGSKLRTLVHGIHAALPMFKPDKTNARFDFTLHLRGTEQLAFAPIGKTNLVTVSSPWPHPSFMGRYLPEKRSSSAQGFEAKWRLSQFATNIELHVAECLDGQCMNLSSNVFGVSLLDPVDVYLKSERSVKYGILFVGLTFVAFFLIEVLKGLRIHPLQYLLVGLGLSIFFLLLLSLAEHIAFLWSYLSAAAACVVLLAYYCSHVLKSRSAGLLLGGVLGVMYSVLYIIIDSEDHALLMGSGLLFLTLATVMVLTRKLDWYAVSDEVQSVAGRMRSEKT